jgi:hypothetical protein
MKEISFKNSIGQVIEPGDRVITVATGYSHSVSTTPGIYLGLTGQQTDTPVVLVDDTCWGYYDKDGKNVGYSEGARLGIKGEHRAIKRKSVLPLGRVYKLA